MIPITHFSQSALFDTSNWRSIWDLTLTLKQARKTDDGLRWIRTDEYQCRESFRHFINLLNRAVYGNAARRNGFLHGKMTRLAHLYGPAARCKPKVMIWKVGLAHLYPAF